MRRSKAKRAEIETKLTNEILAQHKTLVTMFRRSEMPMRDAQILAGAAVDSMMKSPIVRGQHRHVYHKYINRKVKAIREKRE